MRAFTISLAMLAASMFVHAEPAVHTFRVWGMETATQKRTYGEKLSMYVGWSNGYFQGHGTKTFPLRACIENYIPYDQAIAMIDKYYENHPEKWSNDLNEEIIKALTVTGGPCNDKAPK